MSEVQLNQDKWVKVGGLNFRPDEQEGIITINDRGEYRVADIVEGLREIKRRWKSPLIPTKIRSCVSITISDGDGGYYSKDIKLVPSGYVTPKVTIQDDNDRYRSRYATRTVHGWFKVLRRVEKLRAE